MASTMASTPFKLPPIPARHADFIPYLVGNPDVPMANLVAPFNAYEHVLREGFAQHRNDPVVSEPFVNAVPVFGACDNEIKICARATDLPEVNEKFIMPLPDASRLASGSPAMVGSLEQFRHNFNVFSEASLSELNWDNLIVAGSAVVTSLLPVPQEHAESKRALREYYHQKLAPSSDVDLFIYGLDEAAATEKLKEVEASIRNSVLAETTTIRTKNAITIASTYPTRHVQVVLRLYTSLSEVLTGFDVDCSCFAYDGKQVYGTPRGIAAFITQCNTVDLSRRSPSYESRLAKYAHRGFEVFWPELDRSRVDPTIFERAFGRTVGLARLLVLERLPKESDRDHYIAQRRSERGRPALSMHTRYRHRLRDNFKDYDKEDVAEWQVEDSVSNYHTFTVPYGPRYNAKKIERLLYVKDLLLNAEWNQNKDRKVHLHRHPCFIGDAASIIHDCCDTCPEPTNDEEREVKEEEDKIYVHGELEWMKDDPGRQAIGSFNPITTGDWAEMAYIGNTAALFQAISDNDLSFVQEWCKRDCDGNASEESRVNQRDHTGRTPLHLACQTSTTEIVQCLIESGARIVARLVDGMTALHIAAQRGEVRMVEALLKKSEENEALEAEKEDAKKAVMPQKEAPAADRDGDTQMEVDSDDDDSSMVDFESGSESSMAMTQGSFVKIPSPEAPGTIPENDNGPDVYSVNVIAWDAPLSPLHLAIIQGHIPVIETLVSTFGADVLLPVKLLNDHNRTPRGAIMTLVLAAMRPSHSAEEVAKVLLGLGASTAQADTSGNSVLSYVAAMRKVGILKTLFAEDGPAATKALQHVSMSGNYWECSVHSALYAAIEACDEECVHVLLAKGAKTDVAFEEYAKAYLAREEAEEGKDEYRPPRKTNEQLKTAWRTEMEQPVVRAIGAELVGVVREMIEKGADVNSLTQMGWRCMLQDSYRANNKGESLLDMVEDKIKRLSDAMSDALTLPYPVKLLDDAVYIDGSQPGTHKYWQTERELDVAKRMLKIWHEKQAKQVKELKQKPGFQEKQEALESLKSEFETLRTFLLSKGAKPFKQLMLESHPDYKEPTTQTRQYRSRYGWHNPKPERWTIKVTFNLPDLTDYKLAAYTKLWQAIWDGDEETVKTMTLKPNGDHPPLKITTRDSKGFSPVHIALARGHMHLASTIVDIANAQYQPTNAAVLKTRIVIRGNADTSDSDDDYSSNEEDQDAVRVSKELFDDTFTIDNVATLARDVGSKISVAKMLIERAPMWMFADAGEEEAKEMFREREGVNEELFNNLQQGQERWGVWNQNWTAAHANYDIGLLHWAILKGDEKMVRWIIEEGKKAGIGKEVDEGVKGIRSGKEKMWDNMHLECAVRKGYLRIAEYLITQTGVGLPVQNFVKSEEVEVARKKKYYQGLKVQGKHKAEWAKAAAQGQDYQESDPAQNSAPVLVAAHAGDLSSVEWYLSDTPGRFYKTYAVNAKNDSKLEALSKTKGRIERVIDNWLEKRRELVLHCAVLSPDRDANAYIALLKYLVTAVPSSLHTKSFSGDTPLTLAASRNHPLALKTLIAGGADQTVRDKKGRNIVHLMLRDAPDSATILRELLGCIDARLLPSLMVERSSEGPTGLTPLATWVDNLSSSVDNFDVFDAIAEVTPTVVWTMLDGSGQTPLHQVVKAGQWQLAARVLEAGTGGPGLALVENATGQTPAELAYSLWLASCVKDPPSVRSSGQGRKDSAGTSASEFLTCASDAAASKMGIQSGPGNKNAWRTWAVLQRVVEGTGEKRKLVSVGQASEVAKRLADRESVKVQNRYSRFRRYDLWSNGREDGEEKDEVDRWATTK